MSQPTHQTHAADSQHEGQAEHDDLSFDSFKVIAVAVGAVIVFTIGGYASFRIYDTESRELQPHGPLPIPRDIGKSELGIVDQPMFEGDRRLTIDRATKRDRLGSYGWVDRKAGTVHIPIEKAIDLAVEQEAKQ